MSESSYVLITPARNEEGKIEHTLRSVVAQTLRPRRWVVVNDGSTDRTGAVIDRFAARHEFILPVHAERAHGQGFGSKVKAFEAGCAALGDTPYQFIGNLDADVSLDRDYFGRLLGEFEADPRLGLGGGLVFEEIDGRFVAQTMSGNSVAGAVQLFRRECYEQVGGYLPLKLGGVDAVAEISARMHGWKVRTMAELEVKHHGRVVSRAGSVFRTRFNKGLNNYLIGYHPLFHLVQSLSRVMTRPYLAGSLMMLAGYGCAALRRAPRPVSREFVGFLRNEQMSRLRTLVSRGESGRLVESKS